MCRNPRIRQHRVFIGLATRGKTSTGWFYGFKLHLLTNDQGELLNAKLTPGNVDDRKPLPALLSGVSGIAGKIIADKGYLSQKLSAMLAAQGVELITKPRKNMKTSGPSSPSLSLRDKALLRKIAIIESVIDQLKNISQVEHTRHRAHTGFFWNVAAALIAYCQQPKKPSLNLNGTMQAEIALA